VQFRRAVHYILGGIAIGQSGFQFLLSRISAGAQLLGCLNSVGQCGLLCFDGVFERLGIDSEKNIALFQRLVRVNRNLNDLTADGGNDRGRVEVEARLAAEGMIVVHSEQKNSDDRDPTKHRGQQGEPVNRDLEKLKASVADRRVSENEKQVHGGD
jgi:hypothetical protein